MPFFSSQPTNTRASKLDYLREYRLGDRHNSHQRRHVALGIDLGLLNNYEPLKFCNFAWKHARKLEDQLHAPLTEGVWPINHSRCEFRIGNPGNEVFPRDAAIEQAGDDVHAAARRGRLLCYFRAIDANEAINCVGHNADIRHATELTSDWYDPERGAIDCQNQEPQILGSHAVPLGDFDFDSGRFQFANSWGGLWGDNGCGSISIDHFNRFVVETWVTEGRGLSIPITIEQGIVCLEWKWSLSDQLGVHGREIVDAATGNKLAWAFCVKRRDSLDVEEFFVWPTERNKGYGRELARMVTTLAAEVERPLRLLVSFADTYDWNMGLVQTVARMLNVRLQESSERWVHLLGESQTNALEVPVLTRRRPARPAFMLEWLRSRDEGPIKEPTKYEVLFGTNREAVVNDGRTNFTSGRGKSLAYGWATVEIPVTFRFGSQGRWFQRVCNRLFGRVPRSTGNVVCHDRDQFGYHIRESSISYDDRRQNLLYIHGFNVSFDNALHQAAQFGVDLKLPGRTFVFSWPSLGSLHGYPADEATIEISIDALVEFVTLILESTEEVALSILVHSMGNRAAIRLLEAISAGQIETNRIGHVMFAAPDVDTDQFTQTVRKFVGIPKSATLYATRGDWALQASEVIHRNARAGLFPPVVIADGVDTVTVEGLDFADLGHGYYAKAAGVLHDMFNILHHSARPDARPRLTRVELDNNRGYWSLPLV